MRKRLCQAVIQKVALLLFGSAISLALAELAATAYGYVRFKTFSVTSLYELQQKNTFLSDIEKTGYSYAGVLCPHPYLGFVLRNGYGLEVNNVGLLGVDYPYEKNNERFVILLTGGSVAAQFAQLKRDGVRYLEEILNSRYDFEGKRVVVLNGGNGAWRQPQQCILFLLYADVIDAVITLDGFNEHWILEGGYRLELPGNNFHDVNPLSTYAFDTLAAAWLSTKIRNGLKNHQLLGRSHLAWLVSHRLTAYLRRAAYVPRETDTTTVDTIFSLPGEWSQEKRFRFNMEQYRKYIRAMHNASGKLGIQSAFFIQPVPAIGKRLTEAEELAVGNMDYRDVYLLMATGLLALREEGVPIHELLHVFSETSEAIYADQIHCIRYGDRDESMGYRLMSEKIASILETEWGLKMKSPSESD